MLNCQKMKKWDCSLAMWATHDTFFLSLMFRGFNHQHHHHKFVVLFVGAEMETVHSGFTLKLTQRKVLGGKRPEFSLSYCLSFSFYSLHLSLSQVILVFARSSSVNRFTICGWWREGMGLLECWHVPIRATVLHYSISARQSSGQEFVSHCRQEL